MVQKHIPKLSMKTIKKISSLQRRTEPTKEIINNITPTQNENITMPLMNESEINLDSLTWYEDNIASSKLQVDSDDFYGKKKLTVKIKTLIK